MGSDEVKARWGGAAAVLLITAAAVAAYASSFHGAFIFDDVPAISFNPHTRSLWPIRDTLGAPPQTPVTGRPVVALSLAVNYQISGLDVWSYHAFNLAVHVVNALLVWSLLARTLTRSNVGGARVLAMAVALLWAIHPLNSEAVVYVIQRTELLVSMFLLATLWLVVVGEGRSRAWPWYAGAVVCCVLGVLSKEVMAAAPLLVLLYDRAFLAGTFGAALRRRRWLYAGLALSWAVLAMIVAAGPRSETVGLDLPIGPLEYLCTQAGVIVMYLKLCFWPAPLVLHYQPPIAQSPMDVLPQALLVLALLGLTAWALWRRPRWGFLGAWFFLILAPTSSVVPIVTEVAAERRMYLPSLAVLTLVVLGASRLANTVMHRRVAAGTLATAAAAVAVALGVATFHRASAFSDPLSLWADAVADQPNSGRARLMYGKLLMDVNRMDEAGEQFRAAVDLMPYDVQAPGHLGEWYVRMGEPDKALPYFERAVELRPQYTDALVDLADVLWQVGQRRRSQALFDRAMQQDPQNVRTHSIIGSMKLRNGDVQGAIESYRLALAFDPGWATVRHNLGVALLHADQPDEALDELRLAGELGIEGPAYDGNLGLALYRVGRAQEAIPLMRRAVDAGAADRVTALTLVAALQEADQLDEAVRRLEQVVARYQDSPVLHNMLGVLYGQKGKLTDAAREFEAAVRLDPDFREARANLQQTRRLIRGW